MSRILNFLFLSLLLFFSCSDVPIPEHLTGTLTGQVLDEISGDPLGDVLITTSPGSNSALTDDNGDYRIEGIAEGSYTVLAFKEGYNRGTISVSIEINIEISAPFLLKKISDDTGTISGIIYDMDGNPVPTANIWTEPGTNMVVSDNSGNYSLASVPEGDYMLTVRKPGYQETQAPVAVFSGENTTAYIVLPYDGETNHNPTDLNYMSPLNNAINISTSGTELQWTCNDPDGDSLIYDVYLWTSTNDYTRVATALTVNNYSPSLNTGTSYFWMIVAKDARGGINPGPIWQFTTIP